MKDAGGARPVEKPRIAKGDGRENLADRPGARAPRSRGHRRDSRLVAAAGPRATGRARRRQRLPQPLARAASANGRIASFGSLRERHHAPQSRGPLAALNRRRARRSESERRTPNAERRTPNAERRTPNAERRTPNAERRTPNAERRTPNAERRTPNAERRTPNAERRTPNAERRTPNAERRTPNAERRTPNAERRTPAPKHGFRDAEIR
ncbi:hypothetical protein NQH47_14470 [Burkholderia pseudomallei]|uniref:hypothetical protein n=1 Tax=Burkholderia pseudomallei TaxID=28450 RepID=UPI000AB54E85|nr:hypothetical protein [Burkholderia pseudomallei]MCQ8222457.1 hypothetical protein [Burkholderia pseudomallei]